MLSRSETLIRLIKIRKIIYKRENNLKNAPDDYHIDLKKELDRMLLDIIGVPEEGQHQINDILKKVITGEIKPKTAVVAFHEIYNDYHQNNEEKEQKDKKSRENKKEEMKVNPDKELKQLYQSGYR